jgi:hypothetical protein
VNGAKTSRRKVMLDQHKRPMGWIGRTTIRPNLSSSRRMSGGLGGGGMTECPVAAIPFA